jgi:hypothetical protein
MVLFYLFKTKISTDFLCLLDEDGTIYYFNESTGESRWDKPTTEILDDVQRDESFETFIQGLKPEELTKLVMDTIKSKR